MAAETLVVHILKGLLRDLRFSEGRLRSLPSEDIEKPYMWDILASVQETIPLLEETLEGERAYEQTRGT